MVAEGKEFSTDNLGEYLKREREKKGITLEEAARTTRIRKVYLQAVEDGDFNIQPPIFMKGFIKSYADFLGLDSAVVLESYRHIQAEKGGEAEAEEKKPKMIWSYSRYTLLGIVTLSLLILITITKFLITQETEEVPAPIKPPIQAVVAPPPMTNRTSHGIFTTATEKLFQTLTTPKMTVAPPAKPEVKDTQTTKMPAVKYNLLITAKGLTWLRITMDSREPVEVLMKKGETTIWAANQRLVVLSGNAGGVELTLNGKPLGSLGPSGKVVTKTIPE